MFQIKPNVLIYLIYLLLSGDLQPVYVSCKILMINITYIYISKLSDGKRSFFLFYEKRKIHKIKCM